MTRKLGFAVLVVVLMALLVLATTAAAGPPVRVSVTPMGSDAEVGWVQTDFWARSTVKLKGAEPDTQFYMSSVYWTGDPWTTDPVCCINWQASLTTDARGNAVMQYRYADVNIPAGITAVNFMFGEMGLEPMYVTPPAVVP